MVGRAHLLQDSIVVFPFPGHFGQSPILERSANVPLNITNIYPIDGEDESLQLSNKLRSLLKVNGIEKKSGTGTMKLTLSKLGNLTSRSLDNKGIQFRFHGQFLDDLIKIIGTDGIKLMVTLKNYQWTDNDRDRSSESGVRLHEMRPRRFCNEDSIVFEESQDTPIDGRVSLNYEIKITLSIIVYADMSAAVKSDGNTIATVTNDKPYIPPQEELVSFMEYLLNRKFQTDMVIISASMTQHPCHKLILTSNSPVFETMFNEAKYKESKSSSVHIKDMSEEGVTAFLGYLYHLDVTEANNDFEVTMQLLEASEKYGIGRLQTTMKRILMSNPSFWKEPEKALRLFCFVRNVNGCQELKTQAVKVIKTFHDDLMKSEAYMDLFTKQPSAAMDLCNEMSKV